MKSYADSVYAASDLELELRTNRIQKAAEEHWENQDSNLAKVKAMTKDSTKFALVKSYLINAAAKKLNVCMTRCVHIWEFKTKDALSTQGIIALTQSAEMRGRAEMMGQATHEISQACGQVAEHVTAQAMEENLVVLHRQRVRNGCISIKNWFRRLEDHTCHACFSYWKGFIKGVDRGNIRKRVDELDRISRIADLYRVQDHETRGDIEEADSETRLAMLLQYKHGYLSKPFMLWKDEVVMTKVMAELARQTEKEVLLDSDALKMKSLNPIIPKARWFHRWRASLDIVQDREVRDELKEEELETRYHTEISELRAHIAALVNELKRYEGIADITLLGVSGASTLLRQAREDSEEVDADAVMGQYGHLAWQEAWWKRCYQEPELVVCSFGATLREKGHWERRQTVQDLAAELGLPKENLIISHVAPNGLQASFEAISVTKNLQKLTSKLDELALNIEAASLDDHGIQLGGGVLVGLSSRVAREPSTSVYIWPERGGVSMVLPLEHNLRSIRSMSLPSYGGRMMTNLALKHTKHAELSSILASGLSYEEAGEILYHQIDNLDSEAPHRVHRDGEGNEAPREPKEVERRKALTHEEEFFLHFSHEEYLQQGALENIRALAYGRWQHRMLSAPFVHWKSMVISTRLVQLDRIERSKQDEYLDFYQPQLVSALEQQALILRKRSGIDMIVKILGKRPWTQIQWAFAIWSTARRNKDLAADMWISVRHQMLQAFSLLCDEPSMALELEGKDLKTQLRAVIRFKMFYIVKPFQIWAQDIESRKKARAIGITKVTHLLRLWVQGTVGYLIHDWHINTMDSIDQLNASTRDLRVRMDMEGFKAKYVNNIMRRVALGAMGWGFMRWRESCKAKKFVRRSVAALRHVVPDPRKQALFIWMKQVLADLYDNQLTTFPESFGSLTVSDSLGLQRNQHESLTKGLGIGIVSRILVGYRPGNVMLRWQLTVARTLKSKLVEAEKELVELQNAVQEIDRLRKKLEEERQDAENYRQKYRDERLECDRLREDCRSIREKLRETGDDILSPKRAPQKEGCDVCATLEAKLKVANEEIDALRENTDGDVFLKQKLKEVETMLKEAEDEKGTLQKENETLKAEGEEARLRGDKQGRLLRDKNEELEKLQEEGERLRRKLKERDGEVARLHDEITDLERELGALRVKRAGDQRELQEKILELEARLTSAQHGEGKDKAALEDEIARLREQVRTLEDKLQEMLDRVGGLAGVPARSLAQYIAMKNTAYGRECITRSIWWWNAITQASMMNQEQMEHQYRTLKKESACLLMVALRLELYRMWHLRPFTLWARGQNYDIVRSWK